MKYYKKYPISIFFITFAGLLLALVTLRNGYSNNDSQANNFDQDLNKAEDHWVHNRLGRQYSDRGDYEKAIEEYNKAIEIIQNSKGNEWPNLKKEDVDRINGETKNDTQIFPRYQLVQVYEKAKQYQEAIEQIDWLLAHKPLPHVKEELLLSKERLDSLLKNSAQRT